MASINVMVEFYARMRELIGEPRLPMDLPMAMNLAALRRKLATEFPQAAGLLAKSTLAVNEAYADDATELRAGDRVAVLPPVSGG